MSVAVEKLETKFPLKNWKKQFRVHTRNRKTESTSRDSVKEKLLVR